MAKATSKSAAGNEGKFLEEMNRELAGWDDPAARLRRALARDELQLYCQPILSLRPPGDFTLAETLVRLREEEALMLPPGDFLPAFEHFRMMGELDRWVVRHVARWLAHPPAGAPPRLSVNVAAQTLEDAAFPGFVAGALRAQRVPPQSLIFEVDESDTLSRLDAALTGLGDVFRAVVSAETPTTSAVAAISTARRANTASPGRRPARPAT